MGSRSVKEVDFQRLADALADYRFAYLITVDDDYRVHTVTVEPELRDRIIAVGLIGGRTRRNVEKHGAVTLLWPPSDPGGYSLIVDGTGHATDTSLRIVPSRAVLHRKAAPDSPATATGGLHDCVPLEG
jgi:hypothetical protein